LAKNPTVTEYAIILVVLAIIVFVTYETLGQDIGTLITDIHT
jgi:Flp pilus assembly pilin Flp